MGVKSCEVNESNVVLLLGGVVFPLLQFLAVVLYSVVFPFLCFAFLPSFGCCLIPPSVVLFSILLLVGVGVGLGAFLRLLTVVLPFTSAKVKFFFFEKRLCHF